jgi:undecaprenyl-diphosphatase
MLPLLDALNQMDVAAFRVLNTALANPVLDAVMVFVSSKYTWIAVGAALLGVAIRRRSRKLVTFCIVLGLSIGLVDFVTYNAIKPLFARERPCRQFTDERLLQQWCGGDYGFPSNHAANGMAATVLVGRSFGRKWALWALAVTALVGFSRIYIGVHFPGDVLGGFFVGAVLGFCCDLLRRRLGPALARWAPSWA